MARRRVLIISTIIVALIGVAAWYELERGQPVVKAAAPPVPVTVAVASRGDLPVYLTGLGTVQASFTVGIRPQVDGKLEQVLFKEGDHVRKGDVLAKIDPRLYQAALDQAKAQKKQDEARLISAMKDLQRSRTLVDKNFQTQQVVDQQQSKVEQLIASIDADKAAIETAQTQLDHTSVEHRLIVHSRRIRRRALIDHYISRPFSNDDHMLLFYLHIPKDRNIRMLIPAELILLLLERIFAPLLPTGQHAQRRRLKQAAHQR